MPETYSRLYARYERLRAENEQLRTALHEIYPTIAGRVVHLQTQGEERAAAEWDRIAVIINEALATPQERKHEPQ